MSTRSKQALVMTLALVLPALALAADPKAAEKVAQGMTKFNEAINTASAQLDSTLNAMNAMTQTNADLVDAYKDFSKQVGNLSKMAEKARGNAEKAAAQRDDYLKKWQESQAQIQNPQLKATSEARRAELEPKIEAIKSSLGSASTTYKPLEQDLKDLTVFLGNNLNPSTVAAAKDMMAKVNTDGASVKADLAKASAAVQDLANSIKPGGPAPATK